MSTKTIYDLFYFHARNRTQVFATGKSVTYYIDRYTVPMVREYLEKSSLSIVQIAEEMNFTSLSYFSRYVTRHLGMSPRAYRKSLIPK